jgi:hypothetical protein
MRRPTGKAASGAGLPVPPELELDLLLAVGGRFVLDGEVRAGGHADTRISKRVPFSMASARRRSFATYCAFE